LTEVEILSIDHTTLYRDADGDGFGDANNSITNTACGAAPEGYVLDNTDFNDAVATAYPNAVEICDNIDNNNNGNIDEVTTDGDDDGINDCQDNCPDTPVGERIGINGCSCSQLTLDDGDFCTTDICKDGLVTNQDMTFEQETILLQNTNQIDPIYTANQTITTEQNVIIETNKEVRFYAGNSIILKSGFAVETGAKFEAKIVLECVDNSNSLTTETAAINRVNLSESITPLYSAITLGIAPNPFSSQALIRVNLSVGTLASLQIYNLNGQLIDQILDKEWLPKGESEFIYTPVNPLSGMYYMVLKTNDTVKTKPIIMVD